MFRVTRYPMIPKTESGRVGYRKKYRVAGRVRVPTEHWRQHFPPQLISLPTAPFPQPPLLNADMSLVQNPETYILIQAPRL